MRREVREREGKYGNLDNVKAPASHSFHLICDKIVKKHLGVLSFFICTQFQEHMRKKNEFDAIN